MKNLATLGILWICSLFCLISYGSDRLVLHPPSGQANGKHIVLIAGDEEYRSEQTMPMLGKILSQRHGFRCTVLFSLSEDGSYIDPNNQQGLRGLDALETADLMIIGTRFRQPDANQARYITRYLNAGKPVIGIRTATHAFRGAGSFGGIPYDDFGLKILGETWVRHHGKHKQQGCRGVVEPGMAEHPILNAVESVFCPSDVYGVEHLTDQDVILMRGAVTESLAPDSPIVAGPINDPMQPFAWLHTYQRPDGSGTGRSFCTTGGAAVDFVDEGMRRMLVNACYFLLDLPVPDVASVEFVDPFYPSFFGFIRDPQWFRNLDLQPEDFVLGSSPQIPDPPGSPAWPYRAADAKSIEEPAAGNNAHKPFEFRDGERIALVGGSLAERMNLFGHFETLLHTRFPEKKLVFRNFGWPADEVGLQQRPDNYTTIDDPLEVFGPELFICFFGYNEHFAGDSPEQLAEFQQRYRQWMQRHREKFSRPGRPVRFILVSPIAFEDAADGHLPDGRQNNQVLEKYVAAIAQLAAEEDCPFVDLFRLTHEKFAEESGLQYTVNTVHLNEAGDRLVAIELDRQLFAAPHPVGTEGSLFERVRHWVNDKSWLHLQDYRMLNGWYVYGGRRTWDTETFPREFQKIRKMVAVRDQYIWDLVAGKPVPDEPDDSQTGEVYIPETMFGTRDEAFRRMREPKTLEYPTPEESIAQMTVPDGFEVKLFASEREFPELANPDQIEFDAKGRLWVSCMINYPQWLPGSARPGDKLLIFEDTDGDGMADVCKTFYDKLICPTGFEFFQDGVLVVDEPRILFLRDTDGDDRADEVIHVLDGIATDDTHHAMGAWEWSHGGLLYTLEGIAMSTTLETPWGPFRNKGPSGAYVIDPLSWRIRHFRTPGYGNPWCLVFDPWGMGIVGDGTNAKQHWTSPLSGYPVDARRTLEPIFDNHGLRPAVGSDFLYSRHFPDEVQGHFIYACVINMHGLPRFTVEDEPGTAGFTGKRIEDLLNSTDMFFRPVDPKIGPDGALWFGDWCNALIGHMQYSQRDPNRDHEHGRIYRLVYRDKPLLEPEVQEGATIAELLDQLEAHETRTRYRARRELWRRDRRRVLAAVDQWIAGDVPAQRLCEALWLQESFRRLDPRLVERIMAHPDFHARAAAVHSVGNEIAADLNRYPGAMDLFRRAVADEHPRVRLEAVRGLSFVQTAEAAEVALQVTQLPLDYWIEYTLEHTLKALLPAIEQAEQRGEFLVGAPDDMREYFRMFRLAIGPGGEAVKPLMIAQDESLPEEERAKAIAELARIRGGNASRGVAVFKQVCSGCHQIGDMGRSFGPRLDDVGAKYSKEEIIRHILYPNEKIAQGYETVQVLTEDDEVINGFVLKETDDALYLGVATQDGQGKEVEVPKEIILLRKEMKASSMPDGLARTIAPGEFLDLLQYLAQQRQLVLTEDGWIKTAAAENVPLRRRGDWVEISRDGELLIGRDFVPQWSLYANRLLSPSPARDQEFAFHSPNQATSHPAVVIRLPESREIRHIYIENRRNRQFYDRARDLAVWLSEDGQQWQQVWRSEMPAKDYRIDLPEGTRAKYVKIGLDGEGILHLNQVVLFGPEPSK
ncbi:MAG: cytochrome c [Pirellulaceae bacterium]|nr:MAG: cytochrome c [Pirellulaceae bacterium]